MDTSLGSACDVNLGVGVRTRVTVVAELVGSAVIGVVSPAVVRAELETTTGEEVLCDAVVTTGRELMLLVGPQADSAATEHTPTAPPRMDW
ncbi:hypothetical protein [Branchiibius cervicis]|uniref:hypothetical protein n=1 Tax=Branchiibius cervicis TaxID=908252 RepID=UPI00366D4D3D